MYTVFKVPFFYAKTDIESIEVLLTYKRLYMFEGDSYVECW